MHSTLDGLTSEELYLYEFMLSSNFPSVRDEFVSKVKEVCLNHIYVEYKNGSRFIWCPLDNKFIYIRDKGEKSREQEIYEFKYLMKFWMFNRAINMEELADMIGVNQSTISRYTNCKRLPDVFTIKKIADALRINIDDLFFDY